MLAFSDPADGSAMFVECDQLRGSGQWRNASRTHAWSGALRPTWDAAVSIALRAIAGFQPMPTSAIRASSRTMASSSFDEPGVSGREDSWFQRVSSLSGAVPVIVSRPSWCA
jgi:hypothetical protein